MYIYIGIEDLVANALIELLEGKLKRNVLFKELDDYGTVVVKLLHENGERAVLMFSKNSTNEFLRDYSDYFEPFSSDAGEGVRLKSGITIDDLWEKFRSYLSVKVMKAFMDQRSISALGIGA